MTSRKIPAIVERFSRFAQIDLDAEEAANRADLAAYYENRLGEKLAGLPEKDAFIQRLIRSSGGVFTYAECVTNNILEDIGSGSFAIRDYPLPQGIEALFRDTLDRSFGRNGDRPAAPYTASDFADKWRTPLSMILASPEPLPLSTLRSLMNWKDADMQTFRQPLSSLLTETEGALTLFHRSLGEWLERTNTAYAVTREDGISALAEACFGIYDGFRDEMDAYMLLYTTRFLRESRDRNHRKQYRMISRDFGYTDRLCEKADALMENNSFDGALAFCEELRLIFCDSEPEESAGRAYNDHGRALGRIGNIYQARSQFAEAMRCYEEDLVISRELKARYPENPQYVDDTAVALYFCWRVSGEDRYREEMLAIARQHPALPMCGNILCQMGEE